MKTAVTLGSRVPSSHLAMRGIKCELKKGFSLISVTLCNLCITSIYLCVAPPSWSLFRNNYTFTSKQYINKISKTKCFFNEKKII